ncbi:MAG: C4-dicarboxylate ABC transporter [Pseudomonadales bacterium]|jgi:TRAP transporter 4TM/12TM fusion protein|uniref:TRAP transporter permease n=1 Tax=Halopseudomonas aestusnigri TaxID=857252 RepID=UPI000C429042|nr:C4-dicarboxylate ABC transporter [Pseudomonadales bacterium]MAP76399.1 C4-dicarboxylate ABC transporter [Pseudomonadales bacterium]MBP75533.1 C4-dicarboxylate ABC transporter [Pseudomonadales bacterium]MCK5530680.1 TRAP transporter permease [Halopseudomonas aestusnigri]HBT56288.1 C4-dicarboxylate ABC transporter [Pseudomonas sp.]|tara:strand:+ start:11279 stop:13861 length:2583 start_codon:yes stop_codon:yes gene_type:complete
MSQPSDATDLNTELEDLVATSDTGARKPTGLAKNLLMGIAAIWSLFQLWIASPLPFLVGFGVFNSTEARSIHLAFAVFLGFMAYPAFKRSPREYVPAIDWILALIAAFCAAYLYLFYAELAERPGRPTTQDVVVAVTGLILLLEATRRALGPPLMIVALVFIIYSVAGPYMPGILAHRGVSLEALTNHQWLTAQGVFGIALGVSTSFVFLFVLFGSLLDKAGAGNYFIKVAFSLLGHYRGGPAKAAVVASGMTGLISGSSIANTVTTGTFTIPMMKRVGFSAEKAGAVEVASSVNGQIMPPVMGAAAFLMVEYVGISYVDVIKHAFLPALISYIALIYIVHLEAVKAGMQGLQSSNPPRPLLRKIIGFLTGLLLLMALSFAVYYGLGWLKPALGDAAGWVIAGALAIVYIGLLKIGSRYPELELDDPNSPVVHLPQTRPTVMSGLHFILPVIVLIWCLMVEHLSPGLSAFWATILMIVIMLTQRPLMAAFRGDGDTGSALRQGFEELWQGLVAGARNMIGIGIATATAGIIVGAVSQTGVGLVLADLVEILSMGNLMLMLMLTAVLSLILGMGLPTTANYIVVSALLAPVIVTLGQESGLLVPLIAVHLFVFYFGIMADVTPPVGLASFAAAAVSGGDPIRTGFQAFYYSLRTAALPFLFIFNTDLLLIDVDLLHGIIIFVVATIAMLIFAAATQGWLVVKSRWYESLLLLLVAFTLFRPGFWMDIVHDPYRSIPPAQLEQSLERLDKGSNLRVQVAGEDDIGQPRTFFVLVPVPEGANGAERLNKLGLLLMEDGDRTIVDMVTYGSPAADLGFEFDQEIVEILAPVDRWAKEWMWIPAVGVFLLVFGLQWRRRPAGAHA